MSFSEAQIRHIVHDEIRKIIDSGLMMTETTKPAEREGTAAKTPSQTPFQPSNSPPQQQSILTKFPPEMADNLTATLENGVWKIKPTHLLETALFAKTCKLVEDLGGSYVQEPKNKHWEIKA